MSLTGKAIKYLQDKYPNAFLIENIVLRDDSDGRGPYIYSWGIEVPRPTEEELNQEAEAAPKPEVLPPMPSDHDLLMMLYEDRKDGTNKFVEAIDAAKGVK